MLEARAARLGLELTLHDYQPATPRQQRGLIVACFTSRSPRL
jgi:hypothetical protein